MIQGNLKAVLFDLDGTLVDTAEEFVVVVQSLRAEHDLPESASRALLEVEEPTATRPAPPVASGQPIAEGHAPTGAAGATGAPAQEGPQAERSSP